MPCAYTYPSDQPLGMEGGAAAAIVAIAARVNIESKVCLYSIESHELIAWSRQKRADGKYKVMQVAFGGVAVVAVRAPGRKQNTHFPWRAGWRRSAPEASAPATISPLPRSTK